MQCQVTPSTLKSPHPRPIRREAAGAADAHQVLARRRPSDHWLNSPAWMDGASNPPIFFYSNAEILATLQEFRPDHPMLQDQANVAAGAAHSAQPTSALPAPSGPLSTSVSSNPEFSAPETAEPAPTPSSQAGHMVSVTMVYSTTEKGKGLKSSKPVIKKQRNSKFDCIRVIELDRKAFICEWLRVHDLLDQYSPGVHSGPPFKFWWTGSPGGKAGAITIDSDHDYEVATTAISKRSKDCQVSVEFDTDCMDGYHIRKRPLIQTEGNKDDIELLYGTKVPRIDGYSNQDNLHGAIILQLKQKWTCEKHQGEHGELGSCYVDMAGNHLGLNNRKLKIWASAIAAADATKHEPPNTVEFDGIRDGRLSSSSSKARGRTGPRCALTPPPCSDPATLLVTAMLPFLTGLASGSVSAPVPSISAPIPQPPATPIRNNVSGPSTMLPISPMPTPSSELHVCLADFLRLKNVDLTESESALAALDLTPDIIPQVPVARLCDVIPAIEGQIYKLQAFCKEWYERLEDKKHRLL